MSINVGTLEGKLKLLDELSPSLAVAAKNIANFANANKASLSIVAAAGVVAIGAAVAVGAAFVASGVAMVKHSSAIVDMADKYKISTDAIQKWKFAAEQSGTSLEELARGSSILSKNLGEGSKETVAAVRSLGLEFNNLRNSSPEQALSSTLRALSQVKSESVQAALGAQLLGRGFRELMIVAGDLDNLSKRAEELGLVLGEKDLRAAEALGDAFEALSAVVDGFVNNVGAAITSNESLHVAVEGLTQIFANLSTGISQNRQIMADLVSGGVSLIISGISASITVIKYAIDAWTGLRIILIGTQGYFEVLGNAAISAWEALSNPRGALDTWNNFKQAVKDVAERTSKSIEDQMATNTKWQGVLDSAKTQVDALGESVKAVAGKQHEMGAATGRSTRDIQLQTKAAQEAAKAAAEAAKHYDVFKSKVAEMSAELGKLRILEGDGSAQEKALAMAKADILDEQVKKLKEIQKEWAASKQPVSEYIAAIEQTVLPLTAAKTLAAENAAITEKWAGVNKNFFNMMKSGYADMRARALGWADFMSAPAEVQDQIRNGTEEIVQSTFDWDVALRGVADTMQVLGISAESAFGIVVGGLAAGAQAGKNFKASLTGKNGKLDLTAAATTGLQAVGGIIESAKGKSRLQGALSGGMQGAAFGANFGPQGAIVGAGVGSLVGAATAAFSTPKWKKAQDEAAKMFGFKIGDETAKGIADLSTNLNIGKQMAMLLELPKIAADGKKEMRELAGSTGDLMNAIQSGAVPAKEGMKALNEQWLLMREEAQKSGRVGDRVMLQTLKRAKELGQVTPEMTAAINESLGQASSGAQRFIEGLSKVEDLSKINGTAAATAFVATFNAVMAEQGAMAAVDAMGEHFTEFADKMREISPAAEGILAPIQSLIDLATGPMAGLVEAAGGLKDMLVGVADAGYLDAASFTAMQQTAASVFDQMVAGGASAADAIRVMAPTIQAAISAAEQMGVPLDADMQRLRAIAEQNGITFKTDPMLRVVEVLEAIAVKLGAELPAAAQKLGDSLNGIKPPAIVIPYRFQQEGAGLPGGGGGEYNPPEPDYYAASGFDGWVSSPTTFMAGEAGREHVAITPAGGGGGGDDTAAEVRGLRSDMQRFFDLLPSQVVGAAAQHA